MSEKDNLVGIRVNLDKLTKELDKNNHKLKVNEFLNVFYMVMSELEKFNPVVKHAMEKLGENDYDNYICSVIFLLCVRLAQTTMTQESFLKMVERINNGAYEIETPADSEKLN